MMTNNITSLFKKMNTSTQEEALSYVKKEFNVQDRRMVKNEWILGGRIPESYQKRIVEIFQNLLRKESIT